MTRTLAARFACAATIAAGFILGLTAPAANAQLAAHDAGGASRTQSTAPNIRTGLQTAKASYDCTTYAYVTGDWVRIRATPGGEPVLGYAMKWDRLSWPTWPTDYSGNWIRAKDLRTGVYGWISQDWIDWYQPTCPA